MKCYYAHPVSLYGTPLEASDVDTLEALGFTVVNPNQPEHDIGYKEHGMPYFSRLLRNCQILAFRAFDDGRIPAGVSFEIADAIVNKLQVIELPTCMEHRSLGVEETRARLKELGCR